MFARHVVPRTATMRFDVFVGLPADFRLARKIERKCLRDGFPLEALLRNYLDHRRAAHDQHIEPYATTAAWSWTRAFLPRCLHIRSGTAMADRDEAAARPRRTARAGALLLCGQTMTGIAVLSGSRRVGGTITSFTGAETILEMT
ncbi:hypothetical protein [Streptomyces sp. NPDC058304]|uniref:hypothetical protein n=1 Tax=Streptomyces sp. NPDC058304 TaxID=3346437 RepID=UPI0036E6CCAB